MTSQTSSSNTANKSHKQPSNSKTVDQYFLNFFGFVHPYHRFLHIIPPRYKHNISSTYNQDLVKRELEPKGKSFLPEKRLNWAAC